jgi:hypothetical protein
VIARSIPSLAALVFGLLGVSAVQAQLAITEVHSNASTNGTPAIHADWWELTNFGTQPIDLTGYRFNDATGGLAAGSVTLPALVLTPGESMIFVEAIPADDFRRWWGAALPTSVQVFTYTTNGIGLSSSGDALRLWNPTTTNEFDVVDSVDFGSAAGATSTFLYDPVSGGMTARAVEGQAGAFAAADNGDAGSPGVASGPSEMEIVVQPADTVVNAGDRATLTVSARGLPRPRYQWRFKGVPIPGALQSRLVVSNVNAALTGLYSVVLENGLSTLESRGARVSLTEVPQAPLITVALTNQTVLAGGSVTFAIEATGVPQPSYVWTYNEVPIPGQTGSSLTLSSVLAAAAGTYKVTASNPSGQTSSSALLTVRAKPDLRITEVRSTDTLDPDFSRRNGFVPQDWFEVTSFERSPVSLKGWRLDDNSASLSAAYVVTNDVQILPGESVIFVERLTAQQFRAWWGTNELPADLKIITYGGSGFGLSSGGDGLRLWDATTGSNADTVSAVDFPAGTGGVTFNFDPATSVFGGLSVEGVDGVYQAPGSIDRDLNLTVKDIGSPGRIRAGAVVLPPTAPELTVVRGESGLLIRFLGEAGRVYRLDARAALGSGDWTPVKATAGIAGPMEINAGSPTGDATFFRVVIP